MTLSRQRHLNSRPVPTLIRTYSQLKAEGFFETRSGHEQIHVNCDA